MNRNFLLTVAAVMATLGISSFAKDENGKSVMSADQEKSLSGLWGETFVTRFKADLTKLESEGKSADELLSSGSVQAEVKIQSQADEQIIKELREEVKVLKEQNEKLMKSPVPESGIPIPGEGNNMKKKEFKPDMTLLHNRSYFAAANGEAWTGDETIDTSELKDEFGRYVSSDKMQIFLKLVGTTSSLQYMSTIVTDKFEIRASQAAISSVLQTFTPQFTPKGKTKFTPLTIRQYPMKINVEIIPSDLIDDVLGYLYDEKLEPKDMPIVRYIVEQLVKPKLDEERELAFAIGKYKEPEKGEDGKYKPNEATQVCDGYLTILCELKRAEDEDVTWLLPDVDELGTGETLLDQIQNAVDAVSPLYKKQSMTIHADPDLITKYGRAYRDKYKMTKNEDGEMIKVDFTKFTFAPLEGMQGTGAFFITPKTNFKHIQSRDPKSMGMRMTTDDYVAKVLGEWREGVGFWIKEAIFAYLPKTLVDKLAPEGESSTGLGV